MTPDRTARARELSAQAEALDPEGRASFLRQACGPDTDLLAAVESLLGDSTPTPPIVSHARGLADLTADTAPANELPARALIGRRIGPYEIRREIGRGGMGTVYLAVRVDDYHQQVALKVMRAGLVTDQLLQRFRTERQLLAGLNHPHIARLLDGGTTEDGLLYFVMEYIDGTPIDRHCHERALSARARAALLLPVCDAVEYAHRHTVIHRDLKPGNVLVTADGSPKVLDFGLAKRLDAEPPASGPAGGRTETGVILGTPGYMAPEQAGGRPGQTGPAADVWALGAILYELLTGRPPFRADTPFDTLMQVLYEEPVPPSRLHPKLPRDLETVCLKCLQKEPHKRYASAQALADDLQRFLDSLPIRARPVGPVGRLYRWGRRNPKVAVLSALLLLALVSGLATVTWLWRVAEAHAEETKRERDRAERSLNRFLAVEQSFTQASGGKELQTVGLLPLRKKLLEAPQRQLEQFVREERDNPRAREHLAKAYLRLGQIDAALGQPAEGATKMRQAVALLSRLLDERPRSRMYQSLLALAYEHLGVTEPDRAESAKALQRSLEIREQTLREHPEHAASARSQLAFNYFNVGHRLGADRPQEALRWLAKARAIREEEARGKPGRDQLKHLGQTCLLMGSVQVRSGRTAEAVASSRRGVEVFRKLAETYPDEAEPQIDLADALLELELALSRAGKRNEGLASLQQARALLEKLVTRPVPPGTDLFAAQVSLARVCYNLAMLLHADFARRGDSNRLFETTRDLCGRLLTVRPASAQLHYLRGVSCANLGARPLLAAEEALRLQEEARASFEEVLRLEPGNAEVHGYLGQALHRIAWRLTLRGQREEAVPLLREAVVHQGKADGPAAREQLAQHYQLLARVLRELRRPAEAADVTLERAKLCAGKAGPLFGVACDLAACVPLVGEAERRRYTDLALTQLRAAVAAGYADAERLRTEPTLEPLRGCAEFAELVRRAEARAKPRP